MSRSPLVLHLGASASVAVGVPSTDHLTSFVRSALEETGRNSTSLWAPLPIRAEARVDFLFAALNEAHGNVNFEQVLHALEVLASLGRSWKPSTAKSHRVIEGPLCDGPRGDMEECFS